MKQMAASNEETVGQQLTSRSELQETMEAHQALNNNGALKDIRFIYPYFLNTFGFIVNS